MASPLAKRLPRELRNNLGKYLGMFLLLTLAIAFTSGYSLSGNYGARADQEQLHVIRENSVYRINNL